MAEASRVVLKGFELGTDVSVVRFPDRYADKRGVKMWSEVTSLIDQNQHCRQCCLMETVA